MLPSTPSPTMTIPAGTVENYPGGKNGGGLWQWIVGNMPEHEIYVEAFAGSGAVFRNKPPVRVSWLIDKDKSAPALLTDGCIVANGDPVPIVAAGNVAGDNDAGGDAAVVHRKCTCAMDWLEHNARRMNRRWLAYFDPPYVPERRTKQKIYNFEMTAAEHDRFLSIVTELDCLVMISGYWSRRYGRALDGWAVESRTTQTRGGKRVEILWSNFNLILDRPSSPRVILQQAKPVTALAAGPGFRERGRAKRKAERWLKMLADMPDWEREYIRSSIANNGDDGQ